MSESQAEATLRAAEIKPHLLEQWVMSNPKPSRYFLEREDGHPGEHRPGWICNRDATDRFGASTSTNATAPKTCSRRCGRPLVADRCHPEQNSTERNESRQAEKSSDEHLPARVEDQRGAQGHGGSQS